MNLSLRTVEKTLAHLAAMNTPLRRVDNALTYLALWAVVWLLGREVDRLSRRGARGEYVRHKVARLMVLVDEGERLAERAERASRKVG